MHAARLCGADLYYIIKIMRLLVQKKKKLSFLAYLTKFSFFLTLTGKNIFLNLNIWLEETVAPVPAA
jgi:hypothetical protein